MNESKMDTDSEFALCGTLLLKRDDLFHAISFLIESGALTKDQLFPEPKPTTTTQEDRE